METRSVTRRMRRRCRVRVASYPTDASADLDRLGGELDYKLCADTVRSTSASDGAAVRLDDLPAQIEPDPRSLCESSAFAPLVLDPEELFENAILELYGYAGAAVRHGKLHDGLPPWSRILPGRCLDRHSATRRGVFQGVVEKIRKHHGDPCLISPYDSRRTAACAGDSYPCFFEARVKGVNGAINGRIQVEPLEVESQPSGLDPRHVE